MLQSVNRQRIIMLETAILLIQGVKEMWKWYTHDDSHFWSGSLLKGAHMRFVSGYSRLLSRRFYFIRKQSSIKKCFCPSEKLVALIIRLTRLANEVGRQSKSCYTLYILRGFPNGWKARFCCVSLFCWLGCPVCGKEKNKQNKNTKIFSVNKYLALADPKSVLSQTSSYTLVQENGILNIGYYASFHVCCFSGSGIVYLWHAWTILILKCCLNKYWSYFSIPVWLLYSFETISESLGLVLGGNAKSYKPITSAGHKKVHGGIREEMENWWVTWYLTQAVHVQRAWIFGNLIMVLSALWCQEVEDPNQQEQCSGSCIVG